jgi:hypothetical protein
MCFAILAQRLRANVYMLATAEGFSVQACQEHYARCVMSSRRKMSFMQLILLRTDTPVHSNRTAMLWQQKSFSCDTQIPCPAPAL